MDDDPSLRHFAELNLLAESLGYAAYFTATFFLAWPAFLLLPWVRKWIRQEGAEGRTGGEEPEST